MNVEISRNQSAGALSAPGKSVARTSPVEAHRSLRIEGKNGKVVFQTVAEEAIGLVRQVKEGVCVQKQKERDFIQAKCALERILMAIQGGIWRFCFWVVKKRRSPESFSREPACLERSKPSRFRYSTGTPW